MNFTSKCTLVLRGTIYNLFIGMAVMKAGRKYRIGIDVSSITPLQALKNTK
jgi:hypothetical protein